jgi:hypothetical protein
VFVYFQKFVDQRLSIPWIELTYNLRNLFLFRKGKKLAKNPKKSKRELITIKNLKVNAEA